MDQKSGLLLSPDRFIGGGAVRGVDMELKLSY